MPPVPPRLYPSRAAVTIKAMVRSVLVLIPALVLAQPLLKLQRASQTPVLEPRGSGWESKGAFNPAVVRVGGKFVMLYRAQDSKGISRIGYAESRDGIHWSRRADPVLFPDGPDEKGGGVEDPRLVRIRNSWILTYTAYNGKDAQLALAESRDLVRWQRRGVILPAYKGRWNVNWTKSGAILDRKIGGHYWMYFMADARDRPDQTGIAWSDDLIHWTEPLPHPVLPRRPGHFDSRVTEPGPPPVLTRDGILLIYNGADDRLVYRTGWALFDPHDPSKLIARSDQPIFEPELEWERTGQVPNVVFVEGMVRRGPEFLFWYGGADRSIGLARSRRGINSGRP